MKPKNRVVVDKKRLQELLRRLKSRKLKPEDYELLEGMAETWQYLCSSLEQKQLSIQRLRGILFGSKTEKTEKIENATWAAPPITPATPTNMESMNRQAIHKVQCKLKSLPFRASFQA